MTQLIICNFLFQNRKYFRNCQRTFNQGIIMIIFFFDLLVIFLRKRFKDFFWHQILKLHNVYINIFINLFVATFSYIWNSFLSIAANCAKATFLMAYSALIYLRSPWLDQNHFNLQFLSRKMQCLLSRSKIVDTSHKNYTKS